MPPAIQTAPDAPKSAAAAPATGAPSPTQVFENKIPGQLQFSNQIDSRQPNLSTTAPKYGLTQWNHIRKHRGAQSPFFKKIPDSGSLIQSRIRVPHPGARLFAQKGGIASLPPAQVSENKIAGQLLLSNQIDTPQPALLTTVKKSGLTQWNQIHTHCGAQPPICKNQAFPTAESWPVARRRGLFASRPLAFRSLLARRPLAFCPLSAIRYPLALPGTPNRNRMATRPPRSSPICQE